MAVIRTFSALAAAAAAVGIIASGCSPTNEEASTATTTEASASAAATTAKAADLKSLVPTPANTAVTKGPDAIANDGAHLHFQVDGAPKEVMNAFKADLQRKGWDVTTIVTSLNGGAGGGATYTGTNGEAYGVFDGGGYQDKTWIDVCAWPSKPANPNCQRGDG